MFWLAFPHRSLKFPWIFLQPGAAFPFAVKVNLFCGGWYGRPPGPIPIARSVFRKVVKERAAFLAADAPKDVGESESLMGASIRSTIGVPLWRGDEILGV